MADERRSSKRFAQRLPIRLTLRTNHDSHSLAGPITGNLTNISTSGAEVNLTRIFIDNHHLFYAPRDNPEFVLFMDLIQPDNPENFISLPVLPVWFDRDQSSTEDAFVMGVEFTLSEDDVKIKQFIQMIKKKQLDSGNWLQQLVEKIVGEGKGKKDSSEV
jgi:hypothetical protein